MSKWFIKMFTNEFKITITRGREDRERRGGYREQEAHQDSRWEREIISLHLFLRGKSV
jgi:hypothetical protein